MRAVVRDLKVVRAKQVDCRAAGIVVELVDEQDIGIYTLDGFRDVGCLGVVWGGKVVDELTGCLSVEAGVEGGDREGIGRDRLD